MQALFNKTIREIALEAPATTRVFENFKIDYCCGGRRSIADACSAMGLDPASLIDELDGVINAPRADSDPERLRPSKLIEYIIAKHHIFTAHELERLAPLMAKVALRHGASHPELLELQDVLNALTLSLMPHMLKEENVLFPYIQELELADARGFSTPPPHFGTVQNPIRMMMAEHDVDGERLRKMRQLTADYTLPEGACPSFTSLYAGLQDLEGDLHRHIHLENNVLFPAAAELETHS